MRNIFVSLVFLLLSGVASASSFDLDRECFSGDPVEVHRQLMALDITPKFIDLMESYPELGYMTVYQGEVGTPEHRVIFLSLCD